MTRSEVRINAVVHLRTVLPPDSAVPIALGRGRRPGAQLPPAERHDEIWATQKELDFPGYVFGLDRRHPDLMVQLTERYAAASPGTSATSGWTDAVSLTQPVFWSRRPHR